MPWGDEQDGGEFNSLRILVQALDGKVKLSDDGYKALITHLEGIQSGNPQLFEEMLNGLGPAEQNALVHALGGETPDAAGKPVAGGTDPRVQALNDLQNLLGLGGGDSSKGIDRKIDTNVDRTIDTTRKVDTTTATVGKTDINLQRQTRRYIDVPTEEEFLNNFQNGFSAHVKTMMETGALLRQAGLWAIENMDMFLGDYMGELGKMAAAGQDIFTVVGATGEPQFLGQRAGEVTTQQQRSLGEQDTAGRELMSQDERMDQTSKQQTEEITNLERSLESLGITGTEKESIMEQARTRVNERSKTDEAFTRHGTTDQLENLNLNETENVFSRPSLAYIFKMSPLQYLQKQWSPQSMLIRFEGMKGTRARQAFPGGDVSARRV